MNQYDILIVGAGPGGIFSAYEAIRKKPSLKIGVFETGHPLEKRKCPIDGKRIKSCINCPVCSIMNGFGGAGAFSDGKYNITEGVFMAPSTLDYVGLYQGKYLDFDAKETASKTNFYRKWR